MRDRAINDQYLREMSWILTEIQVENSPGIDSQEWQSWLQKSNRIIADLENVELIDLGDFLRQICDRFKQSTKEKGLNFVASFPE